MKKFSRFAAMFAALMLVVWGIGCSSDSGDDDNSKKGDSGKTETTYTVTINATENGTVTASKTSGLASGETVTLTVTPNSGYELESLSVKNGNTDVSVTDNSFKMPAGNVTVSATFKTAQAAQTSYSAGDVLLKDGTIISYANISNMTNEQKSNAVGILYALDEKGVPRGWLGVYNTGDDTYAWSESSKSFADIVCTPSQTGWQMANNATFEGDTDGSDNWAYICSQDPTGTADAANKYPAFNWVNNYATTYGLSGTYAEGWYMPTIAEICHVHSYLLVINEVLDVLGQTKLCGNEDGFYYWSSSPASGSGGLAYYTDMHSDYIERYPKSVEFRVCCIRKFTEGTVTQETQPTYSVTVNTIGKEYAEYEAFATKTSGIAFRETVVFDYKVKSNGELKSISVKCGDTEIPVVDNKFFTMPAGDVTLTVTLKAK